VEEHYNYQKTISKKLYIRLMTGSSLLPLFKDASASSDWASYSILNILNTILKPDQTQMKTLFRM